MFSCDKDSDTEPEILRLNESERVTILMSRGLEWVAEHLKKKETYVLDTSDIVYPNTLRPKSQFLAEIAGNFREVLYVTSTKDYETQGTLSPVFASLEEAPGESITTPLWYVGSLAFLRSLGKVTRKTNLKRK